MRMVDVGIYYGDAISMVSRPRWTLWIGWSNDFPGMSDIVSSSVWPDHIKCTSSDGPRRRALEMLMELRGLGWRQRGYHADMGRYDRMYIYVYIHTYLHTFTYIYIYK